MAAIMAAIMEITENIMRRMHEPSTKLHNALYFMSGMMVVILALVIVARGQNEGGKMPASTLQMIQKILMSSRLRGRQIPHRIPVRKSGRRVWSLMKGKE